MTHRKVKLPRVALVIETTRAYGRRIIEGVLRYVKEHEPWLVEMAPRALTDPLPRYLVNFQGDGMIVRLTQAASLRAVEKVGVPVVSLKSDSRLRGCLCAPAVTDQEAIGRLAAEHFMERGFRHFGFVGSPGLPWSDGRLRGFRLAVEKKRGQVLEYRRRASEHWNEEGLPVPGGARLAAWVRTLQRPVGILAADDFVGVNLLNSCRLHGIAVPDEVAVVGVDDEESLCRFSVPPLSSIIPDNSRLGYEAAARLDRLMKGGRKWPSEPTSKTLTNALVNSAAGPAAPPYLQLRPLRASCFVASTKHLEPLRIPPLGIHVRGSSDTVAIEDAVVAGAMAFIRENACSHITMESVARHAGVAPSTLQRRFQAALGRPVYESILRVKIDTVQMLLVETGLSLKEISYRAGFEHMEHLAALFRKRTGQTLLEYRTAKRR